jgi:hypothetical protein
LALQRNQGRSNVVQRARSRPPQSTTVTSNFDPGFRIHDGLMHRLVDNVESAGF